MELISRVRKTIKKYSMISRGDSILIGLSGGPDSVCLAIILGILRDELDLFLNALYIDHGLRPGETGQEKEFCSNLCEKLEIAFHFRSIDVSTYRKNRGLNLQEAARQLRYDIYEEEADRLRSAGTAIGHTADDQAETVLMRLLRGAGRKGLNGIPPVRGRIVRPLIETERKDIEDFLQRSPSPAAINASPPYVIDSSNLGEKYDRNWVRHSLIREIKTRNPSIIQDICRTADIFREEEKYLEVIVTKTLMRLISRKNDRSIELFLSPLARVELPVLRRVLRRAVGEVRGLRGLQFVHIEDIIRMVKTGTSGDSIDLPGCIRVIREYSLLKITADKHPVLSGYEIDPPGEICIGEAGLMLKAGYEERDGDRGDSRTSVLLDAGGMSFPLRIRGRAIGDYFFPLGFGKKKKLQDFFVDEKIPRDRRDVTPIVVSGNDIIWVAGYRADDRFKVTEKTDRYLRLTIRKL